MSAMIVAMMSRAAGNIATNGEAMARQFGVVL
jgi:hypothetical protein